MSYEEIDRSVYGKDVFTNGAEGRYAKPKPTSTNDASEISIKTSTTKKRAPKATSISTTDNPTEEPYENEYNDEVVKTKKKTRKVHENGETQNEDEISQINSTIDGEIIVKSKKKRASKIDLNNENIDSIPIPTTATTTIEKPVKKKKSKAPKSISLEEDFQMLDNSLMDELDEAATEKKVKKTKKHRTSKKSAEPTEYVFI
ncbi:unnamed protein product [Rotaria sp. Silwood1]|nr:unnamed protein product [Rotaria sp. Silwood1]CAF4839619.1 unnamed protein product [Rotaria sp. Silwood1]